MLDDRDRSLLALLQTNAGTSMTELAERVNLSVSACSRRVQRLRDAGYIARDVALLDRTQAGLPTTIFAIVRSSQHSAGWVDAFRAAIVDIPEIVEVHRLTGNFDYILKIVLPNVEHYDVIYKRLVNRIVLSDISAYISMETLKFDTAIPTDYA